MPSWNIWPLKALNIKAAIVILMFYCNSNNTFCILCKDDLLQMGLRSIQYLDAEDYPCWNVKHFLEMSGLRFHWKVAPSEESVALLNSTHSSFTLKS